MWRETIIFYSLLWTTHAHTRTRAHTCTHARTRAHTHTHNTRTHTLTHSHTHTYYCQWKSKAMYVSRGLSSNTHTHTHTHTLTIAGENQRQRMWAEDCPVTARASRRRLTEAIEIQPQVMVVNSQLSSSHSWVKSVRRASCTCIYKPFLFHSHWWDSKLPNDKSSMTQ